MYRPSILFINRVFPPDRGATGRCLRDLAGRIAARGWRVSVLACGAADAPSDAPEGVSVIRAGDPVGGSGSIGSGYLSALHRLHRAASRIPRHDLIVTMTDPPMLAVLGPLLGRRWGCGVIHWSHDLYPDLFPVVGVRLAWPVASLLRRTAAAALRRCDAVVAIGSCMADRLSGRGVPAQRIVTIPNWPDPVIRPIQRDGNPVRAALGLEGRFTVAYSGNFGLAHPLDAVLEAAVLRLRPILMTTGAMVLGALPLALATGAGAESRQQIGWVIVGGMSLGTLLTLFVVPTMYTLMTVKRSQVAEDDPEAAQPAPAE